MGPLASLRLAPRVADFRSRARIMATGGAPGACLINGYEMRVLGDAAITTEPQGGWGPVLFPDEALCAAEQGAAWEKRRRTVEVTYDAGDGKGNVLRVLSGRSDANYPLYTGGGPVQRTKAMCNENGTAQYQSVPVACGSGGDGDGGNDGDGGDGAEKGPLGILPVGPVRKKAKELAGQAACLPGPLGNLGPVRTFLCDKL